MDMDKKTAYIMAYLGAFTLATALACGSTTGGGEPCDDDSQCSAGFVCDQGVNECIETCSSDLECATGEACLPRQGTSSGDKTCQIDSTANNNNMNNPNSCVTVDDCPNADDYICNDKMMCELIPVNMPSEFVVLIQDTTQDATACTNNDPGSDLSFARLLDENGEIIGFASQIDVNITEKVKNNYQGFGGLFDGSPNGIDGGEQCRVGGFSDSTVVSVGCSGYILAEFLDDQELPIALKSGMTIEVGEYGTQCNGSPDDEYEVSICSDTADAKGASIASCTRDLGKARGFGSFSL